MRGLELLTKNRPIGAKFMPKWSGKQCETEVYILDEEGVKIGIKVLCKKTKAGKKKRESTYYYIEDTATGDMWDSTGVGKEVPPEITKALNLTDINIQLQKDPPFLATNSGSQISKTVNKITGLDVGDQLSTFLTKKYNEQKAIVKNINADLAEETENLKSFPNIKDLEKWMNELEKTILMISKTDDRISNLENYLSKLEDNQIQEIPDLDSKLDELTNYIATIYNSKVSIKSWVTGLEAMERLKALQDVPNLSLLFGRVSMLNSKVNQDTKKIQALKKAVILKADFTKARLAEQTAGDEYISFLLELKKCPTCFQSVDEAKLKQIIQGVN